MKKITKFKEIKKFLANAGTGCDSSYFWVLFKPINDEIWAEKNEDFNQINDGTGEVIDEIYLYLIVHRIITRVYVDDADDDDTFFLSMDDCDDSIAITPNHIEYICEYNNDTEQEEFQKEINDNLEHIEQLCEKYSHSQSSLQSGMGNYVMSLGKKAGQTVVDGAMLGVGKRASKILQANILDAMKKGGVPEAVLENEVFKAMILVAGPALLKQLMVRFPRLKLNKPVLIQAIDMACVSSVADASDAALEQIEKLLKPFIKEFLAMTKSLPQELVDTAPKKIKKPKEKKQSKELPEAKAEDKN